MKLKLLIICLLACLPLITPAQLDTVIYMKLNKQPTSKEKAFYCITLLKKSDKKFVESRFLKHIGSQWSQTGYSKIKVHSDSVLKVKKYQDNKLQLKLKRYFSPVNDSIYYFEEVDKQDRLWRTGYTKNKFPLHLVREMKTYYENGQLQSIQKYKNNRCIASENWDADGTQTLDNRYVDMDSLPEFPGGQDELFKFISKNIRYPQQAKNKRIRGKVLVQFVITDKGKVSDVEVIKSAHPLLDEEARRVVSSMPNWKPAKFMGEHVNVMYQVPINFKLTAFW